MKNKDNTLPLAKSAKVSPFGYGYSTPTYGGSGSGNVDTSKDYIATPEKALKKHFSLVDGVNAITKDASKATVVVKEASGTSPAEAGSGMFKNDFSLRGIPTSAYDDVKTQISGSNAVVFISRGGGEANDIKRDGYTHYIRFENGGGIQVKAHRLFATQEEAENSVPTIMKAATKPTGYRSPYDYMH